MVVYYLQGKPVGLRFVQICVFLWLTPIEKPFVFEHQHGGDYIMANRTLDISPYPK